MDKGGEEEGEDELNGESSTDAYTLTYVQRQPMGISLTQGTQTWAVQKPRGMGISGRWEEDSRRGHMYTYGY